MDVFAPEERIWNWADLATYRKTQPLFQAAQQYSQEHFVCQTASIDTALTNRKFAAGATVLFGLKSTELCQFLFRYISRFCIPKKLTMGEAGYFFTNLVGKSFMVAIYCGYTSSFGQCVAREYKVRARSSNTCLSSSDYIFNSNLAQLKFSAGLVIYTTQLDWSI